MKIKHLAVLLVLFAAMGGSLFGQVNNARMLSTPNSQTGTSYTFVAADTTRVVTFSNVGAVAATLPNGATFGFGAGTMLSVVNLGAGTVTITCSSCTITANGSASATLGLATGQGADLYGGIGGSGVNYVALPSPSGSNAALLNANNAYSQTQTFNGLAVFNGGMGGARILFQQFTASGTFTIPANVTAVKVTVVGGGGGGGGGAAAVNGGGGGGSGSVAMRWLSGLTPGNTLTVTVGTSAAGGAATANGTVGNASSVTSGTQVITSIATNGGLAGATNGGAGAGGTVGTGGDVNTPGSSGLSSYQGLISGATAAIGGFGAAALFGGAVAGGSGAVGNNASAPGAGGGGGGINQAGGSSAAGIVIFEWVN